MIITGDALIHCFENERSKQSLIYITNQCQTVIACRVSPKQKAQLVELVKRSLPQAITLAVGDGANDVNMITSAHVGVGLSGQEGQQAARASDYSLTQFKHLRNLLLFHGRENYRRNTELIKYNFYKNLLMVIP